MEFVQKAPAELAHGMFYVMTSDIRTQPVTRQDMYGKKASIWSGFRFPH